jgi:zinc D-Ala-D-Ala carboxypeptidase
MPKYLTAHFTLDEMVFSQTASRLGIDNTPPRQVVDNLRRVCEALEEVRRSVGALPVLVSSGYRCPELNRAVRGSRNSAHMGGLAVDFTIPRFGSTLQLARAVAGSGIGFEQVIHEYGRWVHLGLPPESASPARETLSIFQGTGYLAGLRAAPVA